MFFCTRTKYYLSTYIHAAKTFVFLVLVAQYIYSNVGEELFAKSLPSIDFCSFLPYINLDRAIYK